jgi:hypothetical protein
VVSKSELVLKEKDLKVKIVQLLILGLIIAAWGMGALDSFFNLSSLT